MKISYLLVTKNNSKTLEKTLKSLPGKILAIDLNSNDNTLDILKKYNVEYLTKFGANVIKRVKSCYQNKIFLKKLT